MGKIRRIGNGLMNSHNRRIVRLLRGEIENPQMGAEVGVWEGGLSESLLSGFPTLQLLMVDRYEVFDNGGTGRLSKVNTQEGMLEALNKAMERTLFAKERRIQLVANSLLVASIIQKESLDFAHIDADHHYEKTLADLEAYFPKVKPGGLLSGDDYHSRRGWGVKKAVDEFADDNGYDVNVVKSKPLIWWFKK